MMHAGHQRGVVMRKPKPDKEQHAYHQYVSGRKPWCQMFSLLFLILMKKKIPESYCVCELSFAGFKEPFKKNESSANHPSAPERETIAHFTLVLHHLIL